MIREVSFETSAPVCHALLKFSKLIILNDSSSAVDLCGFQPLDSTPLSSHQRQPANWLATDFFARKTVSAESSVFIKKFKFKKHFDKRG